MSVQVMTAVTIVSVVFGFYQGLINLARNAKLDNNVSNTQMTTVIVKLGTIELGITEIKNKLECYEDLLHKTIERVGVLEASCKIHHSRPTASQNHG